MINMKFAIVLISIQSVWSIEQERYLDPPQVIGVELVKPEGLYIQWWPVRQRESDPVVGYKIRLWEIEESSDTEIKLVNYERYPGTVKDEQSLQPFTENNTNPYTREEIVSIKDCSRFKETLHNVIYNKIYEIRVLAFKKDMDGPMSSPIRIKTIKDSSYEVVVQRTLSGCKVTVPSEVQYESDPYPHYFNSDL